MKNVLITGATGGIGQSLVKVFHLNGYNVCATGTNVEKTLVFYEKKNMKLASKVYNVIFQMTISLRTSRESNKYYGSTNILINNAGITKDNLFSQNER